MVVVVQASEREPIPRGLSIWGGGQSWQTKGGGVEQLGGIEHLARPLLRGLGLVRARQRTSGGYRCKFE
jgi:hypothetical protein